MWGVTVGRQESSRAGCEQRETIVHLQGALSALMWWGTAPAVVPHVGLSDCLSENVMLMCLAEVSMRAVAQLSHSTGWGKSKMFLVTIWDGLKCPLGMCLPHLQCCHEKSFIPSSSPSCISIWHELSTWCIKVQEKGRRWTFYFVRVIFIFFYSFLCFCFFRDDFWGQVYFLFSVSFSSLSSPCQGLVQVVYFLLWFSFALDPDSGFQDLSDLPEASRPSNTSRGLLQLTASARHSLIGGVLLVSCFLIGWLVMGDWGELP